MRTIDIPIRTVSRANISEHWGTKGRRVKKEREAAFLMTRSEINARGPITLPVTITFTRIAPRTLDRGDNIAMCFKAMKDGVAQAMDIDDDDVRLTWLYAQEKGKPKEYAVAVTFAEGK